MIRYSHTNLIAKDVPLMIAFYRDVLGCRSIGQTRDLSGDWVDRLTGIPGAHIFGEHLALPGFASGGPTLEIFGYDQMIEGGLPVVNEPGFGHLAFQVDDVEVALSAVLGAGGGAVGGIATTVVPGVGTLRVVYARDPEGNILELQNWS